MGGVAEKRGWCFWIVHHQWGQRLAPKEGAHQLGERANFFLYSPIHTLTFTLKMI